MHSSIRNTTIIVLTAAFSLPLSCSANAYALEPVQQNVVAQAGTGQLLLQTAAPVEETQEYTVSSSVAEPDVQRDGYEATSQAVLDARKKAAEEAEAKKKAEEEAAKQAAVEKAAAEAAAKEAKTSTTGSSSNSASSTPLPKVTPNPGSAQEEGLRQVKARGWGDDQFSCLVSLWNRESGWNLNAMNASSGAYGIPQALPGSKMASAGSDWQTNAATQIKWGLDYIAGRYTNPCGAWAHSESTGWY